MADIVLADPDIERQFIGVLMCLSYSDPGKAKILLEQSLVVPSRLYDPAHVDMLKAVEALLREGRSADEASVWTRVKTSKPIQAAGGAAFVAELAGGTSGYEAALPTYADAICKLALRRRLVTIAGELRARAMSLGEDAAKTLSDVSQELGRITIGKRSRKTLLDAVEECIGEMQDIECGRPSRLLPSGIIALDNITGGLSPTLIVIGARPGVGKSAILATIATSCAQAGTKVGVFSLEDSYRWIAWRVIARESHIPQLVLQNRQLDKFQKKRLEKAIPSIVAYGGNVLIESTLRTPLEITQAMRDMVLNCGVRVLAVDHLGEVRLEGRYKGRVDLEVGETAKAFRDVANELQVPVILFSQIARRPGKDEGSMPDSSEFKNSGDIEAAARVLIGLAREKGADLLKMQVLKNTNGSVGKCEAKFIGLAGMVRDCEGTVPVDLYSAQGEADVPPGDDDEEIP